MYFEWINLYNHVILMMGKNWKLPGDINGLGKNIYNNNHLLLNLKKSQNLYKKILVLNFKKSQNLYNKIGSLQVTKMGGKNIYNNHFLN